MIEGENIDYYTEHTKNYFKTQILCDLHTVATSLHPQLFIPHIQIQTENNHDGLQVNSLDFR